MRIITNKEELELTPIKNPLSSPLNLELAKMKVGQKLFVLKEEWTNSTPLTNILHTAVNHSRSLLRGMKFSTQRFIEGWVITKLKGV